MAKKPPFVYGKSPNPRNWHDTADILKGMSRQKKRESIDLKKKLAEIERLLKEKT